MANLTHCKRCGTEMEPVSRATNQKFCGHECYESWWNEERSQGLDNADRAERLFGPVEVTELSPAQAAWLAAFMDGEGTIGVNRQRKPKNRSGYYYIGVFTVTNTNFDIIAHARTLIGRDNCSVRQRSRKKYNKNAKDIYELRVYIRALPDLLRQLHPYLIVKKRQAELLLKFCEAKNSSPWVSDGHEIYEHYYEECKALNKRGVK